MSEIERVRAIDRFRLDGKVALVTGGARGLGAVFSTALASAGAGGSGLEEESRRP